MASKKKKKREARGKLEKVRGVFVSSADNLALRRMRERGVAAAFVRLQLRVKLLFAVIFEFAERWRQCTRDALINLLKHEAKCSKRNY